MNRVPSSRSKVPSQWELTDRAVMMVFWIVVIVAILIILASMAGCFWLLWILQEVVTHG